MTRRNSNSQQMLNRVFDFGATHAELFPKETVAGELLGAIGQAITSLSGHSSDHVSGYGSIRTHTLSRTAARKALENYLGRMDQTARALKFENFYMPRNRSDSALIDAGTAFAKDAAPLKDDFVKQGFPAGFIEGLVTAVEDLKRAAVNQSASKGRRKRAAEDFDETLKRALQDVERFDALVANTLYDKPGILAEWNTARRVGRPVVRHRLEPATSPQTEPAAPAS